ncbi:hypothetical protein [Nitrosomonas sp. JL21]|uniref:hypothetical protein n=1 Tax=Nitrosomonas sp. JL21 TaxID=153949 RepID=UPI00136874FF|nr:hypothetical protein [Nitrosomonas sp. JL21]
MSQRKISIGQRLIGKWVMIGILFVGVGSNAASAQETLLSAKEDYITCWKQPCVLVAGSEWSEKNPNGVGISVRMGTQSGVTDDQIKTVLTRDFKKHGMTNIKFFFEQNDAPAAGISFHVRGGTQGLFFIDNVREKVAVIAKRAANTNPVFQ